MLFYLQTCVDSYVLLSGNATLRQWEPKTIRTYLIRMAGKPLTNNQQLTVKTPDSLQYPKAWSDWVAVGLMA